MMDHCCPTPPPCASHRAAPLVDISPLTGRDTAARRRTVAALGDAAESNGFLCIEGHGIDPRVLDRVKSAALRWFEHPLTEKMRYYIGDSPNHRGFVPRSEKGNYADETERLYEAFDLGLDLPRSDPLVPPGHPLLGPNVWPDDGEFQRAVSIYFNDVMALGFRLVSAFEEHLRLRPGAFRGHMRAPTSQLRLLHYVANDLKRRSTPVNMGAHTDYECFTILHQGGPGLQVLDVDDRWVDVEPQEGTFAVNIGDMLEAWTNGRYRATVHRVVNLGRERLALPFFVAADYETVVEPMPELLRHNERPGYDAIVAGHHLLGQLMRDFPYLSARVERGELALPFEIPDGNPFELRRQMPAAIAA